MTHTHTHSSAHIECRKMLIACMNTVLFFFFFYPQYVKWCSVLFCCSFTWCYMNSSVTSAQLQCGIVHFNTNHRNNMACLSLMTHALFVYSATGSHDVSAACASARWLSVQANATGKQTTFFFFYVLVTGKSQFWFQLNANSGKRVTVNQWEQVIEILFPGKW